jgi:hypothetical protein
VSETFWICRPRMPEIVSDQSVALQERKAKNAGLKDPALRLNLKAKAGAASSAPTEKSADGKQRSNSSARRRRYV